MKSEVGILAFWILIIFVVILIIGLYFVPAQRKLHSLDSLFDKTQQKNDKLKDELENLENEMKAFDDPFYIEKLLRSEYNWKSQDSNEIFMRPILDNDLVPLPLYEQ